MIRTEINHTVLNINEVRLGTSGDRYWCCKINNIPVRNGTNEAFGSLVDLYGALERFFKVKRLSEMTPEQREAHTLAMLQIHEDRTMEPDASLSLNPSDLSKFDINI